jgi:hypothetical protein
MLNLKIFYKNFNIALNNKLIIYNMEDHIKRYKMMEEEEGYGGGYHKKSDIF